MSSQTSPGVILPPNPGQTNRVGCPSGTVPERDELRRLPRWAVVAYAALAARRICPLFIAHWPDAHSRHVQAIETALAETIAAATLARACPPAVPYKAKEAADAAFDVGAATAATAAKGVSDAAFAAGSIHSDVAPSIPAGYAADVAAITARLFDSQPAVVAGLRRDFERLREMADRRGWTDDTPVPPEVFESSDALPPEAAEQLVERFRRVLTGAEVLPPLEVVPEVREAVERVIQGKEVSPEERQRITDDFALQYHHGGRQVACLRRPSGVVVLAAGPQEVELLLKRLEPEHRDGVVIEYPDPW